MLCTLEAKSSIHKARSGFAKAGSGTPIWASLGFTALSGVAHNPRCGWQSEGAATQDGSPACASLSSSGLIYCGFNGWQTEVAAPLVSLSSSGLLNCRLP